jgi:hypothetical protein
MPLETVWYKRLFVIVQKALLKPRLIPEPGVPIADSSNKIVNIIVINYVIIISRS